MQVKLVAIDVDGTLLNDQYQITDRTKKSLARVREAGAKVILATGRGPGSCYPIIEELQLIDPMITHNGAVILETGTRKVKLEVGYKAAELFPIIQFCRERKLHFDVNTSLDMYIEGFSEDAEYMYEKFFMNPTRVSDASQIDSQIVKFTIFAKEHIIDNVFEEIKPLFPQWSIIRSGEMFIDVIHPRATKGFALQTLMNEYGIKKEEVIAFGNYYNDLEMLELAGIGVAMDNSPEPVKEKANRVTLSNNEDGVALVLEEIIGQLNVK